MFLAIAFLTGCSSTPQTPPATQLVTIAPTPNTPIVQNTTLNSAFASVLSTTVMSNGVAVAGTTVTFSAPSSGAGGTFAGGNPTATGTTDSTGIAVSPVFTANGTVGIYNIIASTVSTQATALFNMSNTLTPASITSAAGDLQSQTVGAEFTTALSVTVMDASGTPVAVSGLPVTFTAPATGASGYFVDTDTNTTTATTNSSGVATAALFVAGPTAGSYTVTASYSTDGATGQTTFTLTNNP
jgi:hypothetical protein